MRRPKRSPKTGAKAGSWPHDGETPRLVSCGRASKTVGNHISNIFRKLQVNDRSQAIVRALRGGLVENER